MTRVTTKRSRLVLAAVALGTGAVLAAPATVAAAPTVSPPIVGGLVGPLQIDVGSDGQVYVAQDFAGVLTKVRPNGTTKDLYATPGQEIAGVASRGYDVAFTGGNGSETAPPTVTYLAVRGANGKVRQVADLLAYEKKYNPDQGNVYGFRNLSKKCAAMIPPDAGLLPYTGGIDSHPYALANAPDGGWYVADAGGNDILHVSKSGKVSTYFVLRPQKTVVSAEAAAGFGLPNCVVGKTFAFEPVPTDVEVKSNGNLFVSLLPGGPEDASLGARGAIVMIPPDGEFGNVAHGFLGATNLALGKGGRIYVAEMFGNRVSVWRNGVVKTVAEVPTPASVEYVDGKLYVSINAIPGENEPPNGQIVTIDQP